MRVRGREGWVLPTAGRRRTSGGEDTNEIKTELSR